MITSELSAFLETPEKESVLRAISASDKIVASGVVRLLTVENDTWLNSQPPAVVLFLKNSSERYYKISVIEPSGESEWEPVVQFEHVFSDKRFEMEHLHAHLLVFKSNNHSVGLNFHNSEECTQFYKSVCNRKGKSGQVSKEGKETKKKKKKSFLHGLFGHSKEAKKPMEIGEPTNFRHVTGVAPREPEKMTKEQEQLYQEVMSKLKTADTEEAEMVKKIVLTNESEFRKSMMVKRKTQTPKDVKEKKKEGKTPFWNRFSKSKIDELAEPADSSPTVTVPEDPLNPDWSSNGHVTRVSSAITVTSSFKHSHTLASEPVKAVSTEWAVPRNDAYGSVERHLPQNVYRFEEERNEEQEAPKSPEPERPPELPSRSTSRNVALRDTAPNLPSHRESYRWATKPDIRTHHQVEDFAEIRLSPNPARHAPPPPVRVSTVIPSPAPTPPKAPPLPPVATSSATVPIAPPLPPVATSSATVPVAPPLPDTSKATVRLSAVPQISTDRRSLLDEIQSADRSKILRKVSDEAVTSPAPSSGSTMIDQIQNFLDARRAGINPSDSEDSDDDDDDDEDWSD